MMFLLLWSLFTGECVPVSFDDKHSGESVPISLRKVALIEDVGGGITAITLPGQPTVYCL